MFHKPLQVFPNSVFAFPRVRLPSTHEAMGDLGVTQVELRDAMHGPTSEVAEQMELARMAAEGAHALDGEEGLDGEEYEEEEAEEEECEVAEDKAPVAKKPAASKTAVTAKGRGGQEPKAAAVAKAKAGVALKAKGRAKRKVTPKPKAKATARSTTATSPGGGSDNTVPDMCKKCDIRETFHRGICKACNTTSAKLHKVYGSWPTEKFKALSTEKKQASTTHANYI